MKCAFFTLGCKVNQYESRAMAQGLEKYGFECVPAGEEADVYIINSCTVTAESDRKTRQAVRRFRNNHPDSIIVLTGCMPQAFPDTADLLPQADVVTGNTDTDKLFAYIMQFINTGSRVVAVNEHFVGEKFRGGTVSDFAERTRAVVKIEDGCNRFCTYCIIPHARGRVRSKSPEVLRQELSAINAKGYAEVVLVGINLSAYGTDISSSLVEAVKIAAEFESIKRIRLGSLEPDHITPEVIEGLSEIPKLCPQFHISLQSGCDRILKKMNRHYTTVEYEDLCTSLREKFPGATLTTDVMVGFPGETDSDFGISLDFVRKIGFEKVHVFPYSRRPGTPAASMDNQVENTVKQHRAEIMADETEKIRQAFLLSQVGKTVEIIPEEHHRDEVKGYTENYIPVTVKGKAETGKIISVKITGVEGDSCTGEQI